MPSLIIRRDGKPTREFQLEKELILIGQKADADINIEDPDGIEERASIMQIGDDFILNELDTAAGTLVNGQPVKKCILKDRDLINIGEYRMTFQDKRESTKPVGIEQEVAEFSSLADGVVRPGKPVDPLLAGPGKKTELVTYVVLGVIVAVIFFVSYQSYMDRQNAEVQAKAEVASKAAQEAKRKEAAKLQDPTRAFESSMKRTAPPVEAPAAEQKR